VKPGDDGKTVASLLAIDAAGEIVSESFGICNPTPTKKINLDKNICFEYSVVYCSRQWVPLYAMFQQ